MGDLERAFKYPFSGPDWGSKFALGGILTILGAGLGFLPVLGGVVWALVSLLPLGYAYRIFRDHLRGSEGPLPAWEGWNDLFRHGFFVFLIGLGYWIVPGLLYWLGKTLWHGGGFGAFLGVLFLLLGICLGLVAFFLWPMAVAFYAREGERLAPAFRWSGMVEKIWLVQREYFIGWLASLVFILVLLFVRTYFLYVGWILHALGVFYLSLVVASFFGKVCRESMEVKI
jgi:hypothetical protein